RQALRYAAVSIAVMVGDGEFGDVRVRDRVLILQLQTRIVGWARAGSDPEEGARLYRDVVTTADLLRAINLRQELAAHGRRMARDAAQALSGGDPEVALVAAAPALLALRGRDDALDDLIARSSREVPSRALVTEIRVAVNALDLQREA